MLLGTRSTAVTECTLSHCRQTISTVSCQLTCGRAPPLEGAAENTCGVTANLHTTTFGNMEDMRRT
jgi:hypothetical protein